MNRASPCLLLLLMLAAGHALAVSTATITKPLGIPADESTVAYDVNARGQVAAVVEDEDGRRRAVLFEKGRVTNWARSAATTARPARSTASARSPARRRTRDGRWRAFLYERAGGMRDLGTLGGPGSFGMAINEAGHVAGYADNLDGDYRAFLYNGNGALIDLGTLGGKISYAAGINNAGQVVGTATQSSNYRHAFVWDATRGMVDLGTLGGRQSSATAINDAGVIVGASETNNRRWHAFLHDGTRMVDLGALIGYGIQLCHRHQQCRPRGRHRAGRAASAVRLSGATEK